MLWCWILGVFIALLFLLCITRVGVRAAFDGELKLDAKFGWFPFRILPLKKRRKEAGKKAEKKPEKKKKPEKRLSKKLQRKQKLNPRSKLRGIIS